MIFTVYFSIFIILKLVNSNLYCKEGINHCSMCNPITKLCVKCEKEIYIPDKNGGCENSQKCVVGKYHCFECSEDGKLCTKCDIGYFPDQNGGCTYTDNCEIADEIECLKCIENYILIGKENYYYSINGYKFCKSLNSFDFQNCNIINTENGFCKECKQGHFLGDKDKRCINVENCYESSFGICKGCNFGYYLNKKEQKCLLQKDMFINCKISYSGNVCDECEKDFYLNKENKCVYCNYCAIGHSYKCEKCIDGYYLSESDRICTSEINCYKGRKDIGICTQCIDNYYIDFTDGKCKSNLENNDFKNCIKADNGICIYCGYNTYIGEDNKCAFSQNCKKSVDGKCIECKDNYYLGLDNKCTDVENCIYSDYYHCVECIENYFFHKKIQKCEIAEKNLTNCKNSYDGEICDECKNDFYLNQTDNLCYGNTEKNNFYKCSLTDTNGDYCIRCINDYYLGNIDHKCNTIKGCDISENENNCVQCDDYYCLDMNTKKCVDNDIVLSEDKKFYYRCNRTNKEGTKCEICLDGFNLDENGICVNVEDCIQDEKGVCVNCNNEEGYIYSLCLNKYYGCVENLYNNNCLECNDILDFEKCSKCEDGFYLTEDNKCEMY